MWVFSSSESWELWLFLVFLLSFDSIESSEFIDRGFCSFSFSCSSDLLLFLADSVTSFWLSSVFSWLFVSIISVFSCSSTSVTWSSLFSINCPSFVSSSSAKSSKICLSFSITIWSSLFSNNCSSFVSSVSSSTAKISKILSHLSVKESTTASEITISFLSSWFSGSSLEDSSDS